MSIYDELVSPMDCLKHFVSISGILEDLKNAKRLMTHDLFRFDTLQAMFVEHDKGGRNLMAVVAAITGLTQTVMAAPSVFEFRIL